MGEKQIMKVAVIGSRSVENSELLFLKMKEKIPKNCSEIISGGAVGVDQLAERYAKEFELQLKLFPPEYDKYGKKAPLFRNEKIIENSDYVIAFWDGNSAGTAYSIAKCVEFGKPVRIIRL